ncbi:MAG: TAT-variant-translocated molybdopterin oxidoreductase, partial [Bacteroidota bacterium]
MKKTNKVYWKGLEQLTNDVDFVKNADKEFATMLPEEESEPPSRRDFLKMMGFGIAAASLAACEAPVRKAIPYVKKPTEVDPSIPNYYTTTYHIGNDYNAILVKTREGRPIKADKNTFASFQGATTTTQAESSILTLYDQERLQGPKIDQKDAKWSDLDAQVSSALSSAAKVTLVSYSVFSPSTQAAIDEMGAKYGSFEHVMYDPVSSHGQLEANLATFGKRGVASYDYSKAKTIVSIASDILGAHYMHAANNNQFAKTRKLGNGKKEMSRLYSFESNLTLTGANADYRTRIKPSEEAAYVANLYNMVASRTGGATVRAAKVGNDTYLKKAANDLLKSKGRSVVVAGSNDKNVQILVNAINNLLGNYGQTINLDKHVNLRKGNDTQMDQLVANLKNKSAGAVIFYNCNPVYDHAKGDEIAKAIAGLGVTISTADRPDETASLVKYNAPDHHYLESWNDYEPIKGTYSFAQPTISNIFNTRQAQESFMKWSGSEVSSYYDYIQTRWASNPKVASFANFQSFFDNCLYEGVFVDDSVAEEALAFNFDVSSVSIAAPKSGALELAIYETAALSTGFQANNPWLHEMSDPITKACWDNYITVSAEWADANGIKLGYMKSRFANLTVNGKTVKVPILVQPGQADGTIGLALGYGRTKAGKVGNGIGVNAYPFVSFAAGATHMSNADVKVELTDEEYKIAQTQTAETYAGRTFVIQESILKEYQKDEYAGRHQVKITDASGNKLSPNSVTLWKGHSYNNHHWGMAIDLNSCTGCGSCTVACQVENNIPVVGKQEILNGRSMNWLRIDRYYSYDAEQIKEDTGFFDALDIKEQAAANPEVVFQPMMCQQCNNAPCETVCPVAATTH